MKKLLIVLSLLLLTSCGQKTIDGKTVLFVPDCYEAICSHTIQGNIALIYVRDKATNNMYYSSKEGYKPYYNSKNEIMSYDEFVEVHIKTLHKNSI